MDKQLSTIGYWLGLICTVLALIFRTLVAFGIYPPFLGANEGIGISSTSFFHGAALFFLLNYCASRMPAPPLRTCLLQLALESVRALSGPGAKI
jgi:hypothetical protein